MKDLYSMEYVAKRYGLTHKQLVTKCSSSISPWPHMRPSARKSSTWLFSAEDLEAIEQRIRTREVSVDSWGRTKARAS